MSDHGHQRTGKPRVASAKRGSATGRRTPAKTKAKAEPTEVQTKGKADEEHPPEAETQAETESQRGASPGGEDAASNADRQSLVRSRAGEEDEHAGQQGGEEQQWDRQSNEDGTASEYEYPAMDDVAPEDFDTKSFVSCVSQLSSKIRSDNVRKMEDDFDEKELTEMVHSVNTAMNNYKNYTMHSQKQMEDLREHIREAKDRMLRKVQGQSYDPRTGERVPLEERQLDAKIQGLNKELAKAAEELARAQQVALETESAAVQSAQLAEQAAGEAEQIQKEFEARKEAEAESRRAEERRRQAEEKRKQEEEERNEEEKQREEARRAKLRKEEMEKPEWEDWPIFTYRLTAGEFDHGICCLVRADADHFKENMIACSKVDQNLFTLSYEANEELVSNIIRIECNEDALPKPIQIVIPHCTSRGSAMSREPVIKVETSEGWKTIKTKEVHLDEHRDVKLVQGELTEGNVNIAVVTRFKRDYLMFTKKGGRVVSTVDPRVSFTAAKNTFDGKEHFVLQMQPVDSSTAQEMKKKPEAVHLLTTSAICTMEWSSSKFATPLTVNLPVPPNPVKAKKAAAARAVKEAKMKNQRQAAPAPADEEEQKTKKKQERKKTIQQSMNDGEEDHKSKPTKWYMGQYGVSEDDENDSLHLLYFDSKGKWQVVESVHVSAIRLDVVEFEMTQPIDKFIVVRTKTDCEPKKTTKIVELAAKMLDERIVNFVVKQKKSYPREVVAYVTTGSRLGKVLEKLQEDGYTEGPEESIDIVVAEGQQLGIDFRANVQEVNGLEPKSVIFNSQLMNSIAFEVTEVDKFLQKNYDVYRGFVQLVKKTAVACLPTPKKKFSVAAKDAEQMQADEQEEAQAKKEQRMQYTSEVLYEHLIGIPKDPDEITPQPLQTAPVVIRNRDDPVTTDVLRSISSQLGDEWHRLASYLNIKKARIQAIQRNCHVDGKGDREARYLMLLTWLKRVPKGMNKVTALCDALSQADREDLAIELEEIDTEFHNQRKGIS